MVQIEEKDVILGECLLNAIGENDFTYLAAVGALRGKQKILGDLLGDSGASLHRVAGAQVGQRGGKDTSRIDARVLVELLVLSGQEGVSESLGDGVERSHDAMFVRILSQELAVDAVNAADQWWLVIGKDAKFREVSREI